MVFWAISTNAGRGWDKAPWWEPCAHVQAARDSADPPERWGTPRGAQQRGAVPGTVPRGWVLALPWRSIPPTPNAMGGGGWRCPRACRHVVFSRAGSSRLMKGSATQRAQGRRTERDQRGKNAQKKCIEGSSFVTPPRHPPVTTALTSPLQSQRKPVSKVNPPAAAPLRPPRRWAAERAARCRPRAAAAQAAGGEHGS